MHGKEMVLSGKVYSLALGSRKFHIEGFHVTSYQCNCKSSYSYCHVGFLLHSSVLENSKMSCYVLFSSYPNIKLQLTGKNISTYIRLKCQIYL